MILVSHMQINYSASNPKVLIVDDEAAIRLVLGTRLKLLNYDVYSAADGLEALEQFRQCCPDLVILDLSLPKLDGLEVLKEIRKTNCTPLIILSAVTDLSSRISGLEAGADDYLIKPFSPGELEARIKAILRRQTVQQGDISCSSESGRVLRYGELRVDFGKRQLSIARQRVRLTGMEFSLLRFLIQNPGKAFSRLEIFSRVWQSDPLNSPQAARVVDVHISRLRAKIERSSGDPEYIHTARGIGYMFDYVSHLYH